MFQKAIAVVFTTLFLTIVAEAGVVPGRWEKVQAEKPGTEMIIRLVSGEEIRGAFREVGSDSLLVTVAGSPRTLPKSEVAKITTAERRAGRLWKGALIGAGIGTVIGLIGAKGEDMSAVIIPLAAAGWAGIGLGVQAIAQSRVTLYQASGVDSGSSGQQAK